MAIALPRILHHNPASAALRIRTSSAHKYEASSTTLQSSFPRSVISGLCLSPQKPDRPDLMPAEEEDLQKIWQEFFSDPSQWWDHRFDKRNPCYPDFKHKHSKQALWIDRRTNPLWVKGELAALAAGAVQRSVFSWNKRLEQLIREGQCLKAIKVFDRMKEEGIHPDKFTFARVLTACGSLASLRDGLRMHIDIIRSGSDLDPSVGNSLIDMYAKCERIEEAYRAFKSLPNRDVICWTTIIRACVKCGRAGKALELFEQMQLEGIEPDAVTFVSLLNACASSLALDEGRHVHLKILLSGYQSDDFVGSALIDMYAKCGSIDEARRVFENMHSHSRVCWTAMIFAYAKCGRGDEALELYLQMQLLQIDPDRVTFVGVLNACASIAALVEGRYVHLQILRDGFERDEYVRCALIDMYSKCESIEEACKTFNSAFSHGAVCWTSMIKGFMKCGLWEKAIQLYHMMDLQQIQPDTFTYSCILNACASVAALQEGRRVHAKLSQNGGKIDDFLVSCLIDMYSKCGSIEEAYKIFNNSCSCDHVSWTAMIGAFAMHGRGKEAIQLFTQMCQECVEVDDVTFVCILSACSHASLVDEGHFYFECLNPIYGVPPTIEHYVCMIDLLGRVGYLDEAESLIENMPCECNVTVWNTLLASCRIHGNVEMGERIAKRALKLDPDHVSGYVLLSNLYTGAGRSERGDKVHELRIKRQVHKQPGWSWIEVNDHVYKFIANDLSHSLIPQIHAELKSLSSQMERAGYTPKTVVNMHALEGEDKEVMPFYHSEKLALGFGLVSTSPCTPLRIVKNLRVCGDCHTSLKFISRIVGRVIVVRDAKRFHHFEDGSCSCGDYW